MDPRQKAKDLIELAARSDTPEKERLSAAVKAVALIRKHDLLSSPIDEIMNIDNETVRAAKSIFDVFTDPDFKDNVKKVAGVAGRAAGRVRKRR